MHSFLVAFAYMMMVFTPCAVAQWGDVLMDWHYKLFGARRARRFDSFTDPLLAAVRQQQAALTGAFAAAQMEALAEGAFVHTLPQPLVAKNAFFKPRTRFATPLEVQLSGLTPMRDSSFQKAAVRVAARVAQMAEAHRLANAPMDAQALPSIQEMPLQRPAVTFYADTLPTVLPQFAAAAPTAGSAAFLVETAAPASYLAAVATRVRKPPVRAHDDNPELLATAADTAASRELSRELSWMNELIGEVRASLIAEVATPIARRKQSAALLDQMPEEIAA
jgi:hypothetical protein